MKRYLLKTLLILLAGPAAIAQTPFSATNPEAEASDKITVASPNVAGLGQYGSVPVNLSTGQLEHVVPLYDLSYHDLSIPIRLAYNY